MAARHATSAPPSRTTGVDVLTTCLVGALVFLFRFSSVIDLTNDHYMHLSWAQQVLLGELPGRDFVDPGMPLAWGASALFQAMFRGPFSEIVLSALMFGVTAALTCHVVISLTGSRAAGVLAAFSAAALVPRLYNYPKLLVPALTMYLLNRYVRKDGWSRVALACGLAAAVLFRHDLGLYACLVTALTVLVAHRSSPATAARELLGVAGATVLVLSPYLLYVGWSEGLIDHVRRGIEFSKGESHQLAYDWPAFPALESRTVPWSRADATAFLYYFSWLVPVAGLISLRAIERRDPAGRFPLGVAATAFLGLYLPIILRYPLDQRLPDIATPLVVVSAMVGCVIARASAHALRRGPGPGPVRRILAGSAATISAGVLLFAAFNAGLLGQLPRELEETRAARGPRGVISKIRSIYQDTSTWPWSKVWPNSGDFPQAVFYVRACTTPTDYVLMTWASPEYYFFGQRKFAAGHSMFLPPDAFTTPRDQEFMLARLRHERPPIALINNTLAEAFARAYPLVDGYIRENYVEAATYRHYDDSVIAIATRKDLRATSTFGTEGWPCGLTSTATARLAGRH